MSVKVDKESPCLMMFKTHRDLKICILKGISVAWDVKTLIR